VKLSELLEAFQFVSAGHPDENGAYICRQSGRIYFVSSELGVLDEDAPRDLASSKQYLAVPHKNDLDLGRALALRFVHEHLPGRDGDVRAYFSRKGAYSRFRRLLEDEGVLEQWYAFETAATEQALCDWCNEEGLQIEEDSRAAASGAFDRQKAEHFAAEWIAAWNSHDLDRVLVHYADDFEFSSPFIIEIAGESSGTLRGKVAIREYWAKALAHNPVLQFELENVYWGVRTLVIQYRRHDGRVASEWFEFGKLDKVIRSAAQYALQRS
jgi:hypothetical protein